MATEGTNVRVSVKSPLLKRAKELELEPDCRVKDLTRAVNKEFGRRRVVLLVGNRQLKDADSEKTLREVGIVSGASINVLAKLNAGPLGGLAPNTSSLSTESSHSPGNSARPTFHEIFATSTSPSNKAKPKAPPTPVSGQSRQLSREDVEANKRLKKNLEKIKEKRQKNAAARRPVFAKCFSSDDMVMDPTKQASDVPLKESKSSGQLAGASMESMGEEVVKPSTSTEVVLNVKRESSGAELNACSACDKLLSTLQRVECRCGLLFCPKHKEPEKHKCSFDYKAAARAQIAKNNPKMSTKGGSKASPRLH